MSPPVYRGGESDSLDLHPWYKYKDKSKYKMSWPSVCSMPISCPVHKRWRIFNSIQIPQLRPNFTISQIVRCLLFNKICSTIVQEYVHSAFSSLCGRSKCNLICVVIWGGNEEDKTDFNHIFLLPARLPTAALTISQGGVRVGRHCDIWTFFRENVSPGKGRHGGTESANFWKIAKLGWFFWIGPDPATKTFG